MIVSRATRLSLQIVAAILLLSGCADSDEPEIAAVQADVLAPGAPFPLDEPVRIQVNTHCGVETIGVDGATWRTDETDAAITLDWVPAEWAEGLGPGDELLILEVVLAEDRSSVTASRNNHIVVYLPLPEAERDNYLCA